MTTEQKRIWIAEKCGWIPDPLGHCWRKPSEGKYAVAFMNGGHAHRQLPDYLNDLNSCAEMEKVLTAELRLKYGDAILAHLCIEKKINGESPWCDSFDYLNAKPEIKCSAFIAVTGGGL